MLWADWSPGYDGAADARAREGLLARPGQPRRGARLLPGHARRRLQRPGPRRRADRRAGRAHPADAVPARRDDGCIGVEVAESARAMVGPNVTIEIVDGCRPLPAARATRRGERPHPGVPRMTHVRLGTDHRSRAPRRSGGDREGGVRDVPHGGTAPRSTSSATVYTQDDPAFPAGVDRDPRRRPRRQLASRHRDRADAHPRGRRRRGRAHGRLVACRVAAHHRASPTSVTTCR